MNLYTFTEDISFSSQNNIPAHGYKCDYARFSTLNISVLLANTTPNCSTTGVNPFPALRMSCDVLDTMDPICTPAAV